MLDMLQSVRAAGTLYSIKCVRAAGNDVEQVACGLWRTVMPDTPKNKQQRLTCGLPHKSLPGIQGFKNSETIGVS
jgi:hypothetical protein